ncbi:hypothetical protein Mgra_00002875 [Meloidogyne graminicola]|uniref:Uncharacterized protein n=1 Tax=Meloidogyne graminicola TaxID=189291 RepID=A0A8S9ZWV9_9BILA|nr:hypothetical protein Mgra_00002875 [Meloidogyne graminicola]
MKKIKKCFISFIITIFIFFKLNDALLCYSCEGINCNYNPTAINCEYTVRSCMRVYNIMNGITIKAGCLLPFFESCDMLQQIGGDQIRCTSCSFDHCNTITSPYLPDRRFPFGGEENSLPFYPNDRFPQRPQFYGGRGYLYPWWNGSKKFEKQFYIQLTLFCFIYILFFIFV